MIYRVVRGTSFCAIRGMSFIDFVDIRGLIASREADSTTFRYRGTGFRLVVRRAL